MRPGDLRYHGSVVCVSLSGHGEYHILLVLGLHRRAGYAALHSSPWLPHGGLQSQRAELKRGIARGAFMIFVILQLITRLTPLPLCIGPIEH